MAFDIDRFRSERVYSNSASVSSVMADLGVLRRFDAENEKLRERRNAGGFISLGTALVLLIGSAVLADELPPGFHDAGIGLGCAALLVMGVFFILGARLRGLDLPNRRYELVARVLHRLRPDLAPDERVKLSVDFQPTERPENRVGEGSTASGWATTDFVDPWLSLEVRLKDGTHLRLGMTERLQKRQRSRTNARGRLKTKYKQKGAAIIQVQLRVKPERYPQLAGLGREAKKAVRLPSGVSLDRLEVQADRLSLRARMDNHWDAGDTLDAVSHDAPRTVLMMLLSLYQVLNYSTTLRKRAVARALP